MKLWGCILLAMLLSGCVDVCDLSGLADSGDTSRATCRSVERALMGTAILIMLTVALTVTRLFVPTVGHSWPMVFIAFAHFYVGAMAVLLWQSRGNWLWGWMTRGCWGLGQVCFWVPAILEGVMFFSVNG